jgi:hypothetical protein
MSRSGPTSASTPTSGLAGGFALSKERARTSRMNGGSLGTDAAARAGAPRIRTIERAREWLLDDRE